MQNIIDSTDKLFIAYKDNDIEFASQYFPQLIREYPELENPHILLRSARRYAYSLLEDYSMPLDTSIRFINTLFQNLPLQIETIKPFIKSELADWIITVAYYANSRGLLRLVRRLIYRAICTKPSIVFEPKIVYLLKASILKPVSYTHLTLPTIYSV